MNVTHPETGPEVLDLNDLTGAVARGVPLLPHPVDVVVGVGGGGLFAATLIALHLNCALCSLRDLLNGQLIEAGRTRRHDRLRRDGGDGGSFLIVMDVLNDEALQGAKTEIAAAGLQGEFTYCAVFGRGSTADPDVTVLHPTQRQGAPRWSR